MLLPKGRTFEGSDRRAPLREALVRHGQMGPTQAAGRFFPIACVALEVTQRCNLDCSLCYLSDHAELARDVPLDILFDRVDIIAQHYGPRTSVQITGGDPTLRKANDLAALCAYIRLRGMRSCLMTNGIRASRTLLARLARAGLDDVAFHVDLTQERKGYESEAALDALRRDYIDRARGLGLRIIFNTTIFTGNLDEVSSLARFFRAHAHEVAFASFQMQADTGRGVLRKRGDALTRTAVIERLEAGFGTALHFGALGIGHAECNAHATALVAGTRATSPLGNAALIARVIEACDGGSQGDEAHLRVRAALMTLLRRQPGLVLACLREAARALWRLRAGLVRSWGRVHRISLFIHDFMDGEQLDRGRCEACVFMVMTEDGPLSMCVHNAERDRHVLAPARQQDGRFWHPIGGPEDAARAAVLPATIPIKRRKGRLRRDERPDEREIA